MELKEIVLASGAKISFNVAPHAVSKNLFQTIMREMQRVGFTSGEFGMEQMVKDLASILLSSTLVEEAATPCLARCLYMNEKIGPETFEAVERRGDYIPVLLSVVWENITPFLNGLFSQLKGYQEILGTLGIQLQRPGKI